MVFTTTDGARLRACSDIYRDQFFVAKSLDGWFRRILFGPLQMAFNPKGGRMI